MNSTSAAHQALCELIGWPLMYRDEGEVLGIRWPRGLLLHGPPGTGKTMAVHRAAAEHGAQVHTITADLVTGPYIGQSEKRLRHAFHAAQQAARGRAAAVVVFLDELDALCPRRTPHKQHESRISTQLLTLLDGAAPTSGVVVVAATNRPNAIDPALRRPGRLDREIQFTSPTAQHCWVRRRRRLLAIRAWGGAQERTDILRFHTKKSPLASDVDLSELAALSSGYTGADLAAVCRQACMHALISVAWDDIGGLEIVKLRLRQAVEWPLLHAAAFQRLNISAPRGVLLHGPPGCCKTTLARAVAGTVQSTFTYLSGAQLHSMYVGEGEAALQAAFTTARASAPAVLFIDEVDSIAAKRDEADGSTSASSARLLSALLVEMDGVQSAQGVVVLAATNRLPALDNALLRPGRLDILLEVPPPDSTGRLQILRKYGQRMPLAPDVDLVAIAAATEQFTGADLEGLCQEAAFAALRDDAQGPPKIEAHHFQAVLDAHTMTIATS